MKYLPLILLFGFVIILAFFVNSCYLCASLIRIKMKCTIPEISWHNRDPVLSVDIQVKRENENFYRMASGGTDSHVLIWHIILQDSGALTLDCVSDLSRHQKAVNVVRFSPSGDFLASGDDESCIIVWKLKTGDDLPELPVDGEEDNKELWTQVKVLRGHLNDVYDIAWSPDSIQLVSGSIDNTAILWDTKKGKKLAILDDHKNFVQGVAWDPKNKFFATLCSDGKCRVFDAKLQRVVSKASRGKVPGVSCAPGETPPKPTRLFHDDTLKSFYRRLTFSPDGQLLFAPSGVIEPSSTQSKQINVTWVFPRKQFSAPVMYLPTLKEPSMIAKCCPVLFELRSGQIPVVALPYRIVVAIATMSTILIYDSQHAIPIALISNIHYTKLTDLSWSSDGRVLVASSTDGYCSVITFAPRELGDPYIPKTIQAEADAE